MLLFILWPLVLWSREHTWALSEIGERSSIPEGRKPVKLSVIVPAYNETERLPAMMKEALAYLIDRRNNEPKYTWEVIVVDDHSKDETFDLATSFNTEATPVYAFRLRKNSGKGGAVRAGALQAVGETVLMVDADGATRFSEISSLEAAFSSSENGSSVEVAFGSRDHLRKAESVQKRNPLRNMLMYFFHLAVLGIIGTHIKDTQCGFKLFSRRTSRILFGSLHLQRWAFDTEIVLLCQMLNFKVAEVDVDWTEIEGSKLNVAIASVQMLRDMILLRLLYLLAVWCPSFPRDE